MLRHARHALIAALAIFAATEHARAGGLDTDLLSPRAIARAGTTAVSEDGGAALLRNPAGLVRRASTRLQLSVTLHDRDATYRTLDPEAAGNPTISDRGAASLLPLLGIQHAFGRVVVGATYADTGAMSRRLPEQSVGQPPADVVRLFPHRYGGVSLGYRRRALAVGGGVRITDWLGVGLSVSASRIELSEARAVWAGFDGRDNVDDPQRDVRLSIQAHDGFVPAAAAGLLVAPPHMPMELALAVDAVGSATMSGDASATGVTGGPFPAPELSNPSGTMQLGEVARVRAGLRYLGDRITAEAGAELTLVRGEYASPWTIDGVVIRDQTGQTGILRQAQALVSLRNHASVRGAVDVEVVRGFLWLAAGYALRTAATARDRVTPVFGDLGAHTVGFGVETNWRDITLSLGYARSVSRAVRIEQTSVDSVNPFAAGIKPAALGVYDRAEDSVGAALDVAW